MAKHRLVLWSLPLAATLATATGCGGYTSEYVIPADGRPRAVWVDNKVVPMIANGSPGQCTSDVDEIVAGRAPSGRRVRTVSGGGSFYVPVRTVVVVHGHGHVGLPVPHVPFSSGGGGGGGLKLGSGGGGGDIGKGAIVVAVVAIAVLPFIALGLAAGRPEAESDTAYAIDRVNAQTDLARTEGSACDELLVAGEEAK